MQDIHTIIIGGGISGLYYGYQLFKKNIPFIILEKNYERRGKLYSLSNKLSLDNTLSNLDNFIIELGASIIHTNQTNMMNLIKELKMEDEIEELSTKQKSFFLLDKSDNPEEDSKTLKKKWKEIKKFVKSNIDKLPDDTTIEEAGRILLSEEEFYIFSTYWSEWYEVNLQNAKVFFEQEDKEGNYCKFKNGYESLVIKLTSILKDHIYFGCLVNKIKLNNSPLNPYERYEVTLTHNYETYSVSENKIKNQVNIKSQPEIYIIKSNSIFLATDYTCALTCIKYKNLNPLKKYLRCGFPRCCYRFYVYFKRPLNLQNNGEIGSIVGEFESKWSIKINDHLWMISYVDGPLSCALNDVSPKTLIKNWIKTINKHFFKNKMDIANKPISYKDVLFYKAGFWRDAYTILDKKFYTRPWEGTTVSISGSPDSQTYGEICRNLLPDGCNVGVLPKNKGEDTAWVESVLINPKI
jgi:hypothetical protein